MKIQGRFEARTEAIRVADECGRPQGIWLCGPHADDFCVDDYPEDRRHPLDNPDNGVLMEVVRPQKPKKGFSHARTLPKSQ